ncbi:MAG: ATP-binding protein [Thermomicrobiaceae bacterium]|nr:ATP-binding protein [Thermomicrobiaceae bacterium]
MSDRREPLGVVTEGSFSGGLTVRLAPGCPTESLRVGSFVVLEGHDNLYFSLISDMQLRVTDGALAADPPDGRSPFVRRALAGTHTYATVEVRPSLMLENHASLEGAGPVPVRNIPMHFAALYEAAPEHFDLVFGHEDKTHFSLGTPPTMDIPIPIDLEELVTRSNGIFGQSGTGKSVLTRLLLFGLIKSDVASTLVFDMHNEYATARVDEPAIAGMVDLFGSTRVKVFTLDPATSASGGTRDVKIGMNQIEPGDVELLAGELNLTPTFAATSHQLWTRFRERWLAQLLAMDGEDVKAFCAETGANEMAVTALRQKLAILQRKPYIIPDAGASAVDDILQHIQRGTHIILQFGRHDSLLDYMLVANILTRRIHARYTEQVLEYERKESGAAAPRRLVIVLEEAHKFLTPEAASQSIFGTIAREMRKYSVTLLVVDQRPSQIDREVLSQLGTKITGLLSDQQDIDAVLTGVGDRGHLRNLLASLRPRQECLIVGHAIPMPIVLRTRAYERQALAEELRQVGIGPVDGRASLRLLNGNDEDRDPL